MLGVVPLRGEQGHGIQGSIRFSPQFRGEPLLIGICGDHGWECQLCREREVLVLPGRLLWVQGFAAGFIVIGKESLIGQEPGRHGQLIGVEFRGQRGCSDVPNRSGGSCRGLGQDDRFGFFRSCKLFFFNLTARQIQVREDPAARVVF